MIIENFDLWCKLHAQRLRFLKKNQHDERLQRQYIRMIDGVPCEKAQPWPCHQDDGEE